MLEGTAARVIGILEQDQGIDVLDPSVNAQWSQLAALWRRHFNSSLQGNYPLVSVVVPVYKVEPYLSQCLDSLVNQTLLNIEIVVVDDDSPDQSFGIVEQYRCAHPSKVKYFHKPNGGLSSARNYGMQQATGLYIGFVDGDDYVETGMFANLFDCIHLQQLQVACAQYYHYPISGGITLGGELLLDGRQIYHGRDFLRNAHVMVVCNKLYRRPFIQDMPFPSMWFEDIAGTPVIMSRAERVGYIPMPLYHYVQRAGSIVSSQGDPRTLQGIDAIKYALHHALPTERDVVVYMAIKRLLFETKRRPEYTDYYLAALKQLANEALECQHIKSNPELAFWLTSIHVNKKCK
jgi:glycosyltransferase involved in cell wall biosynthesis